MRTRVIEVRNYYKKSQTAFASELGVSRNFINLYENGNRELSDRTIADICRIYNVNEDWLRTGEGEMFKPKDFNDEVTDIVWDIVDKKSLSEEERNQYIELIKIISATGAEDVDLLLRMAKRFQK